MSDSNTIGVRHSVRYLQDQYDNGNKKPLEDLVRAWYGIKQLKPADKRSFFMLGGYHGEPFIYRPPVDALPQVDSYTYWGGYCNHGNVLFPTWHRVYVHKLEKALQSIVPGVMMPFWDETSEETLKQGIPTVLTQEKFELDGEMIDNPLRSFVLPLALSDNLPSEDQAYAKPKGYETVRYPLSGLVGTAAARAETKKHNDQYPNPEENTKLLNDNVKAWLKGYDPTPENPNPSPAAPNPSKPGIYWRYRNCLNAPNYTVFSNTTSAKQWNLDHTGEIITPLEDPHNDVHLAVGGFFAPGTEFGQIADANGDMGENNTAGMDPIFFFHHCNVDRMFWLWQKKNGKTDKIYIIPKYYGTSSSDSQGPTPGIAPGTALDLDTPLNPFVKDEFGTIYTSKDCVNIETQLDYTYGSGSFDEMPNAVAAEAEDTPKKTLVVRGIDRALFQGSFVLSAYATVKNDCGEDVKYYLGYHSVLSRRNVVKCANCLTHLEVIAHFSLDTLPADAIDKAEYHLAIQHRGPELPAKLSYQFEVQEG
ncbi:MAG: tyrosinase family protein [Cyanobacteria bacterium P01_G01_bin.54]